MLILDSMKNALYVAVQGNDPIASYVYNYGSVLIDPMGDYIGFKGGQVTYLPIAKIDPLVDAGGDPFDLDAKGRVGIKPAKWARRVLEHMKPSKGNSYRFPPTGANDYERFSHAILAPTRPLEISIVAGEDIRYWYHIDRCDETQPSLRNSCMRYAHHQPYLDLYVFNPNVRLIIAVKDGKLWGRKLVWTCTDGKHYVDYGYGSESTQAAINDFARKQGFERIYPGYGAREDLDQFHIQLDVWDFDYYPTLDTIRKIDWNTGVLSYMNPSGSWYGGRPSPGQVDRRAYPKLGQQLPPEAQQVVLAGKIHEYYNGPL